MENFSILYSHEYAIIELSHSLAQKISAQSPDADLVILCIGTDRSTGDALGPLVGSKLSQYKTGMISLYGTLDEPVHAMNLAETLKAIEANHQQPYIIAIDACLGKLKNVGMINLVDGPLKPGAGVKKELPPVGDIHITGIVNVGGFMEYFVLQNTRLNLVMKMADVISAAIIEAIHQPMILKHSEKNIPLHQTEKLIL